MYMLAQNRSTTINHNSLTNAAAVAVKMTVSFGPTCSFIKHIQRLKPQQTKSCTDGNMDTLMLHGVCVWCVSVCVSVCYGRFISS